MCTVTWAFGRTGDAAEDGSSFELCFNRDERRDRPPAWAPRVHAPDVEAGLAYLAAEDPQGGGSWLAVNSAGLCVALLNRYGDRAARLATAPADRLLSRGQLVRQVAARPDLASSEAALRRQVEAWDFRAFSLLLLRPEEVGAEAAFTWDGHRLRRRPLAGRLPFFTSSSFDSAAIVAGRRDRFAGLVRRAVQGGADASVPGSLAAFHASHRPERGPRSVCMHRPEARTVSFSQILVRADAVGYAYTPGPPCSAQPDATVWLARTA